MPKNIHSINNRDGTVTRVKGGNIGGKPYYAENTAGGRKITKILSKSGATVKSTEGGKVKKYVSDHKTGKKTPIKKMK